MRTRHVLPLLLLLASVSPLAAEEEPPPVTVRRVREILDVVSGPLSKRTGLAWPGKIEVVRTDPAGMEEVLRPEFEEQVDALHPGRGAAARRHLVSVLARSFARILRAKYGLVTKKIHVSPGALARLPEGTDPDHALIWLVAHEAVHAADDAAASLRKALDAAPDAEARRALHMVMEGRAEHYGAAVAVSLGVPESAGAALTAGRDAGQKLLRETGRRFVAALEKRDPALARKALEKPPATTGIVFHPARYGTGFVPPDLAKPLRSALPGAKVEPLSELLLRKRFGDRLDAKRVEKAFGGFISGSAVTAKDGRRLSLVALEDEAAAARFLAALRSFEGAPAEPGSHARVAPDGRRYRWAAVARGARVAEAVVPADADASGLAAKALE